MTTKALLKNSMISIVYVRPSASCSIFNVVIESFYICLHPLFKSLSDWSFYDNVGNMNTNLLYQPSRNNPQLRLHQNYILLHENRCYSK